MNAASGFADLLNRLKLRRKYDYKLRLLNAKKMITKIEPCPDRNESCSSQLEVRIGWVGMMMMAQQQQEKLPLLAKTEWGLYENNETMKFMILKKAVSWEETDCKYLRGCCCWGCESARQVRKAIDRTQRGEDSYRSHCKCVSAWREPCLECQGCHLRSCLPTPCGSEGQSTGHPHPGCLPQSHCAPISQRWSD